MEEEDSLKGGGGGGYNIFTLSLCDLITFFIFHHVQAILVSSCRIFFVLFNDMFHY